MRKKYILGACLSFCSILITKIANGQIVNVEDKRRTEHTKKLQGRIDLNLSLVKNTKSVLTIGTSARLDHITDEQTWLLLGNYRLAKAGEDNFLNDGFAHVRYGRKIKPKLSLEAFGQAQYNERLQLKFRGLLGIGPRIQVSKEKRAYIGILYMFEYNQISGSEKVFRDSRISTYLSFNLPISSSARFSSTSYYQPIITDFATSRLSSVNTLNLKITNKLTFKVNFNITYDDNFARNTDEVPNIFYSLVNGLRWEF